MGQGSGEQGQVGPASETGLAWAALSFHSGPPGGKATLDTKQTCQRYTVTRALAGSQKPSYIFPSSPSDTIPVSNPTPHSNLITSSPV